MKKPLVSIICICFNHRPFLAGAVQSVLDQTYENFELIIIDDCSTDGSADLISEFSLKHPAIKYKILENHSGNCKAFNTGWKLSQGEFFIDLSADDILMPGRIEEGIRAFENHDNSFGINFTDAEYIDAGGNFIRYHYQRDATGRLTNPVREGNLYSLLLARYYICTPTMMFRKEVIESMKGYDESLAYEDFDFWIRSAKKFRYCYSDKILVKKRILKNSLSSGQYARKSPIPGSTLAVCLKAEKINENDEDRLALVKRASYEFRKSLLSGNLTPARGFAAVIARNANSGIMRIMYLVIIKIITAIN